MNNGLVQSTIVTALRRAQETGASSIRGVHVALGELVEVETDDFRAEWQRLTAGTPAEHAILHIRRSEGELQCMVCFQKYRPATPAPLCPYCGSVGAKVMRGEECTLESIDVDDEQ